MIEAWNKIEPSDETQQSMLGNITQSGKRRKTPQWKRLASVAAAVVVLITGTLFYDNIDTSKHLSNPQPNNENQTSLNPTKTIVDQSELSDEIKGLPVNNFKMSEIEQLTEADRIAFFNFIDFFKYEVDSFAIVKVSTTKPVPAVDSRSEKQISTVNVLETVWGDNIPDTIDITQYLSGGCNGDEVTNLMRQDGVYLLPLIEDNNNYYLISDLDVLFEIDDDGLIWSHSDFDDFNRFDSGEFKFVTDEIKRITQDETIMLSASPFGMALLSFQLAEVTILSEGVEEKNENGYAEITYTAGVERTLSGNDLLGEVTIRSYGDEGLLLNNGGRYLLFIDNYEGTHYVNNNMISSVDEDGRIKNLSNERSPFASYNGYTVDKIKELADEVTEYLRVNQE